MFGYLLLKWNSSKNTYLEILNSCDYSNVLEMYHILKERNKYDLYIIVQIVLMNGDDH